MSIRERWPAFFLFGVLSFFYAEIFSGASGVWFLDPWSLLITLPIYLIHAVLLLNIAFRIGRTGIRHLYLLGVVFGLYEAWITQVLWYGYFNSGEVTVVAGMALVETMVLVFFWHPVFSFIIPVLVFQMLGCWAEGDGPCDRVNYAHSSLISDTSRNRLLLIAAVFVGSVFMTFNYNGNPVMISASLVGSYVIIYSLARLTRRRLGGFDLHSLRTRSILPLLTIVLMVYASFFYLSGIEGVFTDGSPRTPTALGLIVVMMLYVLIGILLRSSPREELVPGKGMMVIPFSSYLSIGVLHLIICLVLALSYFTLPLLLMVLMMVLYLAMIPAGLVLFFTVIGVKNPLRKRRFGEAS